MPPERGETFREVREELAHAPAGGVDLASAADLVAQRRGNPNAAHVVACVRPPAQNSM
jgi:hypothetical protein